MLPDDKDVLVINTEIIDDNITKKILSFSKKKKRLGIDMSFVKTIQSFKFINCLCKNKFRLFNVDSALLAYISLILNGGFLKTHINKQDLFENKRELFTRHFLVD